MLLNPHDFSYRKALKICNTKFVKPEAREDGPGATLDAARSCVEHNGHRIPGNQLQRHLGVDLAVIILGYTLNHLHPVTLYPQPSQRTGGFHGEHEHIGTVERS
ncbi:hypothetical protein BaRGS_00038759 [Batillaria attramentaria]|uniref:Uncharacterized protein n=1 Tax=Batillaria attramentaria TaxID=370345 RepID=A0ABD0J573_9CAEN